MTPALPVLSGVYANIRGPVSAPCRRPIIQMAARIMPPRDIQLPAPLRVAFRTIGCKLNQCETAQMQQSFLAQGYRLVDWHDTADVRVVNTCTVTAKSDRTCRHEIRAAKRTDPECLLAVTGCYAEVDPEAVGAIPGVDLLVGNAEKTHLAELVARFRRSSGPSPTGPHVGCTAAPACKTPLGDPGREHAEGGEANDGVRNHDGEFITHFYGYTRAFLKVQNGCASRCAYCIIPIARGAGRSMPLEQVVEQVRMLAARDYREVVLTGINLGSWGRSTGQGTLADLLAALLADTPMGRFRLSSIEPLEVSAHLLDVIESAGDRVAHHLHLPLQSGSEDVLRRMRRPYTTARYLEVAREVARRFPDAAIGADVIVGFPGETEEHFAETCRLVEASPLTYLHVFANSDRPGTAASSMADKVHPDVIHERSLRLRSLGSRLSARFHEQVRYSRQVALVLRERTPEGRLQGITGNYVEVVLDGGDELMNRLVPGSVTGMQDGSRCEFQPADAAAQEDDGRRSVLTAQKGA